MTIMGLPVNLEVPGLYVIETDSVGVNKKIIVTRLSDNAVKQEIIKDEWFAFLDALCEHTHDSGALELACDTLFAA